MSECFLNFSKDKVRVMQQIGNFLRSNWRAIGISAGVLAGVAAVRFQPQIVNGIVASGLSLNTALMASNALVPFLPTFVISLSNNNVRRNIISSLAAVSVFAAGLWHTTSMAFSEKENKDISRMWERKGDDLTTEAVLRRESVVTKFLPAMALGFASLLAVSLLRSFSKSPAPKSPLVVPGSNFGEQETLTDNNPASSQVRRSPRLRRASLAAASAATPPANLPVADSGRFQASYAGDRSSLSETFNRLSNVSSVSGSLNFASSTVASLRASVMLPARVSAHAGLVPVMNGAANSPESAERSGRRLSISDLGTTAPAAASALAHPSPNPARTPARAGAALGANLASVARNAGNMILGSPAAVARVVGTAARAAGRTLYTIAKTRGFQARGVDDRSSMGGTEYPLAIRDVAGHALRAQGAPSIVQQAVEAAVAMLISPLPCPRRVDASLPGGRTNNRHRSLHSNEGDFIPPAPPYIPPIVPPAAQPSVKAAVIHPAEQPPAAKQGGEQRRSARVAGIVGNGPSAGARATSRAPSAGARATSRARWR